MIQAWALMVDAYRQLNHRKLFWLCLILSALLAAAFGATGVYEGGITLLHWKIDSLAFNSGTFPPARFYKFLFVTFGVRFWLTWFATILALISTAGVIPDLVASGSIDLMLCKPISRTRLFLLKYLTGLLFAALQVTLFTTVCFLVIGIRGHAWEPGIFVAVPVVVLFYSYLYCVCAFLGLWTRSTVASLLLTLLAWMFFSLLWGASQLVSLGHLNSQMSIKEIERRLEVRTRKNGENAETSDLDQALADQHDHEAVWALIDRIGSSLVTVMPKPGATIELLETWLDAAVDLKSLPEDHPRSNNGDIFGSKYVKPRDLNIAFQEQQRAMSASWVIGTSLGFEAVVLLLCVWRFNRRDF